MAGFFHSLVLRRAAAAVIYAAIAPASAVAQTVGVPADVERSLHELAQRADDAWNRRDAAAMAGFYAADATSTIGGQPLKGREQMLAYFTNSFGKLPPGLTHRTVLRRVERIGELLATDNDVFLEGPDGAGGKRVVRQFFTFTLVRPRGDGWEMVAVRATPLAAPVPR